MPSTSRRRLRTLARQLSGYRGLRESVAAYKHRQKVATVLHWMSNTGGVLAVFAPKSVTPPRVNIALTPRVATDILVLLQDRNRTARGKAA